MKWFKHMSDASHDEDMESLMDEFGLEGYARWWLILETIASQMDKTSKCSVAYSWVKWQTILKGKRNKLETFLERLRNKSKINLKQTGNVLEISCPKLLFLRDEYTKKSRQCPVARQDKIPPKNKEAETEEEKTNTRSTDVDRFNDFWLTYPKKVKKKTSSEIWKRKKLNALADDIISDIGNRLKSDRRWLDGYVPDPTTYLNQERWDDEIQTGNSNEKNSGSSKQNAYSRSMSAIDEWERDQSSTVIDGQFVETND